MADNEDDDRKPSDSGRDRDGHGDDGGDAKKSEDKGKR